jgi:hypothetical protein
MGKPVVKQKLTLTKGAVVLRTEFVGARIKPAVQPAPIQYVDKVRCRWCGSTHVLHVKTRAVDSVYRCLSCVDPETSTWTIFTVGRRPDPAPG